jgi:hypothetical protein
MGADFDTNGDGLVDSEALRYVQGESEADYVTRLTQTLRSTVRDANFHFVNNTTSYDYIQSDDTHPTYTGNTISVGIFGGTGTGSGPPDYPTITGGKNPVWNQYGHERMGWSLWTFSDSQAPAPTATATPVPATPTEAAQPTATPTDAVAPTATPTTGSCIADGAGAPCTSSTNCCSGAGNCTGGKPADRVCAASAAECGNGAVESGEDCEAGVPLADSCESLGFSGGTLACGGSCQYDTSGCSGSSCGGSGASCSSNADCCSNKCKGNGICN